MSLKNRIKNAVAGNKPVHDILQFFFRLGRLLFAQWPLTVYHRLGARFRRTSAVLEEPRNVPVIVSLTSFGRRIRGAIACVETLLCQSVRPDRLILWLSREDFEAGVPAVLRRLEKRGLEIKPCEDWRSYKKIIPTLLEAPEAVIVTADDDVFYPRDWLKGLLEAYEHDPEAVHCHRSHIVGISTEGALESYSGWRSGHGLAGIPSILIFPTGVGGVLYPPGSLDPQVTSHEVFMEICPTADDIWLKAMTLLTGTPCRQTEGAPERYLEVPNSQTVSLWHTNVEGGGNDEQLRRVFSRFDLVPRLAKEVAANRELAAPPVP